jgi:hypothetical protein
VTTIANRRALLAGHNVRSEAEAFDFGADAGDIFSAGVGAHDEHSFGSSTSV